jgi:hypothetical protein
MNQIIANAKEAFENVLLTDNYRSKKFTKNFDQHLNMLIDTTVVLAAENYTKLNDSEISITDQVYWESEGFVLENLDDVTDSEILQELSNLEDILYDKIRTSLGNSYDGSSKLNLMIDNSVHNALLAIKYNFFSQADSFSNPWEAAKNILIDNKVLYTFSNDRDKLLQMGFNVESDDSTEIINKKINVVGRGNRNDYTYGYVRDLVGLRNTVLDILEDHSSSRDSATTADRIISELRLMGLSEAELTNSHIKNWLISPLKRNNKIGSHKEGYFLLKNCHDVAVSYESHLENLKGYYRTLENHRKLALKFGCEDSRFEQHKLFFRNYNDL